VDVEPEAVPLSRVVAPGRVGEADDRSLVFGDEQERPFLLEFGLDSGRVRTSR
jgi:hypothetical protein